MKPIILICILSLPCHIFSQLGVEWGSPVKWFYPWNGTKIFYGIDTLTQDTLRFSNSHFYRITLQGDTIGDLDLEEFDDCYGFYDYSCSDDGYHLTGTWHKKYPSGEYEEFGRYACSHKIDEWLYFYENGKLKKYENYFRTSLQDPPYLQGYLNGLYKEYFPGGQTKISGNYKIVEEYTTYLIFDPETYEDKEVCCDWIKKSIKIGIWLEFNQNGKIISKKHHNKNIHRSKTFRDISDFMASSDHVSKN